MNIGIVTTWFERGAAYVSKMYMQELKKNFNVYIYARGGEKYALDDPKWDTDDVHWGRKRKICIPNYIEKKDFLKWISKNNIDVIFFNEQHWYPPILWCKEEKIKTIAYVDYYTEQTIPFFGIYDVLLCNTKRHYEAFSWHKHAYHIPWGTDIHIFHPQNKNTENEEVIFFASAGMSPIRKGTDLLIKAFSKICNNNCKLIIHTQVNLEEKIPSIKYELNDLIEKGKIFVYEKTVSAPGLYHLGDVYVYPSRLDGIGLTVPEALACGLPIIVPDNPPMNEFIYEKFENGLKVNIKRLYSRQDGYYWPQCEINIEDLAGKMLFFVNNYHILEKYKENARKYAISNLDWEKNAEILPEILSHINFINPDQTLIDSIKRLEFARYPYAEKIPILYEGYTMIRKIGKKIYKRFISVQ